MVQFTGGAGKDFVVTTGTPGTISTAVIRFKTIGAIPAQGKIRLTLPDVTATTQTGWSVGTPLIEFVTPDDVHGVATFTAGTRLIDIKTSRNTIPAGTEFQFHTSISVKETPRPAG